MSAATESLPLPAAARYVFVYGTLRRGDVRDINRLSPAPRFVGHASVNGTLYHLGSYPGIVLGGEGAVRGEVYAITQALEHLLDEIEEVWPQQTGEYAKREVEVQMLPGADGTPAEPGRLPCLLYEIAPDQLIGRPAITGGDWLKHLGIG
jgi:gamma-glutamylcyclotransferase (GGCT)/AIG2-like uncharacterized protein YtfP